MIGGVLVDALVVGAVLAFGWAGLQLGMQPSLTRLAGSFGGFLVAALLRDPVGKLVRLATGGSVDLTRLIAMAVVGVGTYLAVASITGWWFTTQSEGTAEESEDEIDPLTGEPLERSDAPLVDPRVAAIPGGALGLGWAVLFVSILMLMPADNFWSRGAMTSITGRVLIGEEHGLRWLVDGFPHYTQTLPKGEAGASIAPPSGHGITMHLPEVGKLHEDRDSNDDLRANINSLRREARVGVLTWNIEVADVAERHAATVIENERLTTLSPSGQSVENRILLALGGAGHLYRDEAGIRVVWAHSAAHAYEALVEDDDSRELLADEQWTEIGIGTIDAGWFGGKIFVVGLIGRIFDSGGSADDAEEDEVAGGGRFDAGGDADGDGEPDSIAVDPTAEEGGGEQDSDGDGIPDLGDADPFVADTCAPNVDGTLPDGCAAAEQP